MCWGAWGTPRASASFAKDAVCHEMQPSTYTGVSKFCVSPRTNLCASCVCNVGVLRNHAESGVIHTHFSHTEFTLACVFARPSIGEGNRLSGRHTHRSAHRFSWTTLLTCRAEAARRPHR